MTTSQFTPAEGLLAAEILIKEGSPATGHWRVWARLNCGPTSDRLLTAPPGVGIGHWCPQNWIIA